MDQFSAHLDRGWELIARNDPRGAESSARRALEIDPQSPEAHNLLGYSAALAGNAEEAIESYRQAIALDDAYFEAMLNAAEVYIHPLHDYGEAVSMCEQALELAETDEERVDALLLKLDALLAAGDDQLEEAKKTLARMPNPPYENAAHAFLVGRAHYELGDIDAAAPLIDAALVADAQHADAWYYQGLLRDERGEAQSATTAFLRSRELELETEPPPWSLAKEELSALCTEIIGTLDPVLSTYVKRATVFLSDLPGLELVADGVDPRVLLLCDGLYPPETPHIPCERIFFYQRNIERLAGHPDAIEGEIRAALEREITATFLEGDQAPTRPPKDLN